MNHREKYCRTAVLMVLLGAALMVGCSAGKPQNMDDASKASIADTSKESEMVVPKKDVIQSEEVSVPSSSGEDASAENAGSEADVSTEPDASADTSPDVGPDAAPETGPIPGEHTLANLLLTAKEPLGNTMYVWGGGWNEEDTGAGTEAVSIGLSPAWAEFAAKQDADYDYKNTRYQIHDGLDCSGYVGWVVYNVFETEDGHEGYVMSSTVMAEAFSKKGWGSYTPAEQVADWNPGDIMSMKGHVWISLGMCEDGSVVLLHASPPGVILSGTTLENGETSQAVKLAEKYMSTYYPEWYERYQDPARSSSYLSKSAQMRWNAETLRDDEQLSAMSAAEILAWLFGEEQR